MTKYLFDLGTEFSGGLKHMIERFAVSEKWIVKTFEANPDTYEIMKNTRKSENNLADWQFLKWRNIEWINKAAWVKNSDIRFYKAKIDNDKEYTASARQALSTWYEEVNRQEFLKPVPVPLSERKGKSVDGASTMYKKKFSRNLQASENKVQNLIEWDNGIVVPAVDIIEFMRNATTENDEIYIKMDIEGAELRILEKLYFSKKILKRIHSITLETHSFGEFNRRMRTYLIKKLLRLRGVRIYEWC